MFYIIFAVVIIMSSFIIFSRLDLPENHRDINQHHLKNYKPEITQNDRESIEEIIEGDIEKTNVVISYGNDLYARELKFISKYINIIKPDLIIKDDFYYCVHNFRCSKLSNVPYLYVMGICSKYEITNYRILKNFVVETSENYIDPSIPLVIRYTWRGSSGAQGPLGIRGPIRSQLILE